MSVPIQPLSDHLVIEQEEAEVKTSSGILLSSATSKKPNITIVLAVGPDVEQLKVGDKVICKEYSAIEVKYGPDTYIMIQESDVMATVVPA